MELDTLVQTLQGEYRALASLHKQQAEHELIIAGLVGKIVYTLQDRKSNSKRAFPENDYGSIATQVLNNPKFVKKRKWATESWPHYAIRISKWVKWSVDENALKTAFELQEAK